ncbi:nucleotidyltransferase AbiEii toxin of type IV toxin-antitoxin system [Actinoplanes italicus]|uniref:Nucleotidyltransferase AbiEii toxin of type IV toxin-antitoxin system n=1 Tax=Actinoplanes italicus TaxID=113567 RepID=A0A2T0KGR5_9ACTN|nr:nucleotidyltransferase AbiEii toxin of type IV toxin-antitoxin system [Actinoplanes italicus]
MVVTRAGAGRTAGLCQPGRVSVDDFYRDVARIALAVADKHGFVLGGGVAWLVNGLVARPTEDIDLFTDTAGGVAAAAGEVTSALTAAGYRVVREDADELFAGMDADIQEFLVAGEHRALRLTLCRLDRHRAPVVMDVGPVMHLDDLVATKVAALVNRREVRDYIDVAAALERYPLDRVLALAHAADPALDPEDIADAGRYLDRLDDARFALYGLDREAIATLRARLRDWPRS